MPGCGAESDKVHGYHVRTMTDVPLDGRSVVVRVRIRRLVCRTPRCGRTFREQVPGVVERYRRRTTRLTTHVGAVVRELAGRAGVRLLAEWAVRLSPQTALRALLRIPTHRRPIPKVLAVDDFSLRRGRSYATIPIDAVTHERIDVPADRKADTLEAWLREHPGAEVVVRDGSATYAEAIRRVLPGATQASDRWHLWHGMARAVEKTVVAHSARWAAAGPQRATLTRENTTLQRWQAVHDLLDRSVGLGDCARRLGLSRNTVKRYARAPEPDRLRRPPQYRACQVDPYREHLAHRRAEEPGVAVTQLLVEITTLGYKGSLNLLYKYLNQGRHLGDRITPSARRVTSAIMSRPEDLPEHRRDHLADILAAGPEMTVLAEVVGDFARLMTQRRGSDVDCWIKQVREAGLVEFEPYLRGLEHDHNAVIAGLSLPYSNGPIEGVNTKTSKLVKRQMYGRAGFRLLRHRILLS